ncbi:major capsid protein [Gordonia sihwensis]|uniref:phage major capsid protein n=1 Tax=Gordonia sihwensis TaxID=173559 RepID=UPI001C92D02D|nr:phage major capsid protein [Gordonia sihwensis]MBY4570380.1 major capsid protein [Gordonia sihwensis]
MVSQTTTSSAKAWRPDLNVFAAADVLPDAAILTTSTVAGQIEGDAPSVRVAYVSDDTAAFVAEGAEIPEGDPTLSEALIYTRKISQLIRISREQYRQQGTAEQLAQSVGRALIRKGDNAYLVQPAPTAPDVAPVAGLVNTTGLENGDEISGSLDALVDLVAGLQANGANPSHIVIDPIGWAEVRKLKTATGSNQSLVGAGVTDAALQLLGLPVVVNREMPTLTGLVIDSTAVVSAVGPVEIATSEEQYFSSDSVAVRATWRTGHTVPRTNRLGKFTVADPTA